MEYAVVLVTAPDADTAARIARALVEERLAACGNVIDGLRSIYRWQGAIEDSKEALLILKTRVDAFERMQARVVELHPYECPEVLRLDVAAGLPAYLEWLASGIGAE
ncbi:MAG TPA: divalent-cation tolerance protein CutA [Vulgatibacter sp.]|nr:divalent-cation tolerance protein CutA [Vulgatibacter sp.]